MLWGRLFVSFISILRMADFGLITKVRLESQITLLRLPLPTDRSLTSHHFYTAPRCR